jgi:O-antigen/teichoic acid export membrane protein
VMVGLAASIRGLALAADPVLYALGHAHLPLAASAASSVVFVAVIAWQVPVHGLAGAGWAFIAMALLGAILSGLWAWRKVESVFAPKDRRHAK